MTASVNVLCKSVLCVCRAVRALSGLAGQARPTSPLAAFESFSDRGDATDGSKRAAPLSAMPDPKRARSDVAAQCALSATSHRHTLPLMHAHLQTA